MAEKNYRVAEQIAITQDERYLSYKQSPEEILMDKERNEITKEFWFKLRERLTEKEKKYLYWFVSMNNKVRATARELTVDEKNVRYFIGKIQKKANELMVEMGLTIDDMKDYLKPQINLNLPHKSRGVGYPFEKYISLPKNKSWSFRWGKQRSPINKTCMIPEYLQASGSNSLCNICSESKTCTRCDAFPENDVSELKSRHLLRMNEVMSNIKATYKPEDLQGLERVANF